MVVRFTMHLDSPQRRDEGNRFLYLSPGEFDLILQTLELYKAERLDDLC